MHTLDLDDEQASILLAGLECSELILKARLERVDPDGKLSDALKVSKHKTDQIRLQLKGSTLGGYADLSDSQRARIEHAAKIFSKSFTEIELSSAYDMILAVVLENRAKRPPSKTRAVGIS